MFLIAAPLMLLSLMVSGGRLSPTDDKAREILARAEQASGVASLKPDSVLYNEYQFVFEGGSGVLLSFNVLNGPVRIEQVIGDQVFVRGFVDEEYYELDASGQMTVYKLNDRPDDLVQWHRYRHHDFHPEAHGGTATFAPTTTRDGRPVPGVRFVYPNTTPYTVYYDAQTFLDVQICVERPDGQWIVQKFTDPMTIYGLTRPMRSATLGPGGTVQMEAMCVDTRIFTSAFPELLGKPTTRLLGFTPRVAPMMGQISWSGVPAEGYGPDPPEEWRVRREALETLNRGGPMEPFIVDGSLNGRHLRLLFDTGANRTMVLDSFTQEMNLPEGAPDTVSTATGITTMPTCTAGVLQFPEVSWFRTPILLTGNTDIFGQTARDVHGVLGMDLLSGMTVMCDPDRHGFVFLALRVPCPPEGEKVSMLPMDLSHGVPIVPAMLEDGKPMRFLVDTGARGTLVMPARALRAHGYRVDLDQLPEAAAQGLAGNEPTWSARVGELRLGDLALKDALVTIVERPPAASDKALPEDQSRASEYEGIIGARLLAMTRFVIDPVARRFHVSAASSWIDREPAHPGFSLEDRSDPTHVTSVMPQSPAARAGVGVDDRIVKIRGVELKDASADFLKTALDLEIGKPWPITVQRGDERIEIVLEIELWPPRLARE